MNSNEIIQVLLESINQITEAKLENLPYDKTLVCTIVDDSQKKDSIYTVQKDSVKFKVKAANSRSYSVNQQVYVKVPLGDMSSNDKYIEGIYAADAENTLNLVTAKDRLIRGDDLTLKIIDDNKSFEIIPNSGTSVVPVGYIEGFNEENFDTIYISAKFQTPFNNLHITSGNYGLKLVFSSESVTSLQEIINKEENKGKNIEELLKDKILAAFKLDNIEDMFGDTYQYMFPMKQEQIYTLKNIKGLKAAIIGLYQSGNFKYMNDFGGINVLPVESENLISVSDVEVLYGFNSVDKPADTVELVCSESKEYGGEEPAERNVQLFWYNYVNGRYVGFNDTMLDDSKGATKAKTAQGIISSIVQPQVSDVEKYYYYIEGLSNLNFHTTPTKLVRNGEELKVGDVVYYSLNNGKLEISTDEVAPGDWYWIDWYVTNDLGALELDPSASGRAYKVSCSPYADPGVDVKAVLWVNGKEYSDTISFKNKNPLLQTTLDLSGLELKIENGSNTRDAYPLYDGLTNRLFTQGEAWHTREVFAKIEGRPINKEFWKDAEVYWYIPKEKTMLVRPDDNYDKTLSENSNYYIYKKKYDDNDEELKKFSYKINDYFVPGLSDNTIKCEIVVRQGKAIGRISGSRTYGFSTFGASGTDYTIIFNKSEDSTWLAISVVDKDGVPQKDAPIQWRWKGSTEWEDYKDYVVSISSRCYKTYNLLEAKAKVIYSNQEVWVYGYYSLVTDVIGPTFDYPAILPLSIIYENTGNRPTYYDGEWKLFRDEDVSWEIIRYPEKIEEQKPASQYPRFENKKFIVPESYTEGIYCAIEAKVNDNTIINYPVYVGINKNQSELLNNWDGMMQINEEGNYILTSMITAGHKDTDGNTFTGFAIGDIGKKLEDNTISSTTTGIFGYHKGLNTYRFETNGNAYIGDGNDTFIDFSAENKSLNIKSTKFKLKSANESLMIEAKEDGSSQARLGGFYIASGTLQTAVIKEGRRILLSNDAIGKADRVAIGVQNGFYDYNGKQVQYWPFKVNGLGKMWATDAVIKGNITADTLDIQNATIKGKLTADNIDVNGVINAPGAKAVIGNIVTEKINATSIVANSLLVKNASGKELFNAGNYSVTIGSFEIGTNYFNGAKADDSNQRIYLGQANIGTGDVVLGVQAGLNSDRSQNWPFWVSGTGILHTTGAIIKGEITATAGEIGCLKIDENKGLTYDASGTNMFKINPDNSSVQIGSLFIMGLNGPSIRNGRSLNFTGDIDAKLTPQAVKQLNELESRIRIKDNRLEICFPHTNSGTGITSYTWYTITRESDGTLKAK